MVVLDSEGLVTGSPEFDLIQWHPPWVPQVGAWKPARSSGHLSRYLYLYVLVVWFVTAIEFESADRPVNAGFVESLHSV